MYTFVFESGVAKLKDIETEHVVVNQPYNPTFNGPLPWQDEAEALQWMQENYSVYFQQPQEPEPEEEQGE
jgi:hypothetical protein